MFPPTLRRVVPLACAMALTPALVAVAQHSHSDAAVPLAHDRPPVVVRVDSNRHEVVITSGPWHLEPMDMGMEMAMNMQEMGDHQSHGENLLLRFKWPASVWIRGFTLEIRDANGKLMPQRTMHHMEVINFDRRQLVYPLAERVLGVGEETAKISLPRTVGIPMDAGTDIGIYLMWNNDTGEPLDGITWRFALQYSPRSMTPRPLAVLPFKVDVNSQPGKNDGYQVPPGGSQRSYEFTVPVSGRLLAAGGHMHDYGVEMRLEDVASGKVLARVKSEHNTEGLVHGVEHQLLAVAGRGARLAEGRRYRMVAVYANPTRDTLPGVMAVLGGLFAPDDLSKWPKVDKTHPDYLLDIAEATLFAPFTRLAGRR